MSNTSKKIRIVVGINSLVSTQHLAYSNHIQFFFRLGRNFPNIEFCLVNPSRMAIDRMRNMAAQTALNNDFDYLLFLDDDVLVPFDGLQKLLDADADIAAGNVIIRGYPFENMYFDYTEDGNLKNVPFDDNPATKHDVINVGAVGFSFALISVDLLKRIPKPFFITGPNNTEDIYFCVKARKHAPNCTIKVDKSIECGHILWSEIISPQNREIFKKYYEELTLSPGPDNGSTVNTVDKGLEEIPDTEVTYEEVVVRDIESLTR